MRRVSGLCEKSLTKSAATDPDIASTLGSGLEVSGGFCVSGGVSELVSIGIE